MLRLKILRLENYVVGGSPVSAIMSVGIKVQLVMQAKTLRKEASLAGKLHFNRNQVIVQLLLSLFTLPAAVLVSRQTAKHAVMSGQFRPVVQGIQGDMAIAAL